MCFLGVGAILFILMATIFKVLTEMLDVKVLLLYSSPTRITSIIWLSLMAVSIKIHYPHGNVLLRKDRVLVTDLSIDVY